MEIRRLRSSDNSWKLFQDDWTAQCDEVGDDFESYGSAPISMIRQFAEKASDSEWAIGLYDKERKRYFASACAIHVNQKGYSGKVLRIREVVICPLLDYGKLPENEYIDALTDLLNCAIKLSESELVAKHIKMHLRSPEDAKFFRTLGRRLDSKDVFAATEVHGAWISVTKKSTAVLKAV